MTSKYIICFTKFFSAIGYDTGQSNTLPKRWTSYTNIFIHLMIFGIIIGFQFEINKYLITQTLLEALNNLILYIFACITYAVIIFELYTQRVPLQRFWKLYQKLETLNLDFKSSVWKSFICQFIGYILFTFLMYLYFIIMLPNLKMLIITLLIVSLLKLCEVKIFHYLFYLNIILNQLKIIENEIKMLVSNSNSQSHNRTKLLEIIQLFDEVTEMINQLNLIFKLTSFIVIIYNFLYLISNINWFVFEELDFSTKVGKNYHLPNLILVFS